MIYGPGGLDVGNNVAVIGRQTNVGGRNGSYAQFEDDDRSAGRDRGVGSEDEGIGGGNNTTETTMRTGGIRPALGNISSSEEKGIWEDGRLDGHQQGQMVVAQDSGNVYAVGRVVQPGGQAGSPGARSPGGGRSPTAGVTGRGVVGAVVATSPGQQPGSGAVITQGTVQTGESAIRSPTSGARGGEVAVQRTGMASRESGHVTDSDDD